MFLSEGRSGMFKNDGTLYILEMIASARDNPLHGKLVKTLCEPLAFAVGECGFFQALFDDGEWHMIITSKIEKLELPEGYERIVMHTKNSVYSFTRAAVKKAALKKRPAEKEGKGENGNEK